MRANLWGIDEGPEWEASVVAADPGTDRFQENLKALRDAIAVNPFGYTRPLVKETEYERYGTTKDVAAGYRLVIFIRVDVAATRCELVWVELEWL